jgi:biotin carboxylase
MNLNEQWLIAVTAGRWQRHGIQEARSAGLKVLAIDGDPSAEGFLDADKILENVDFDDHKKVIEAIKSLDINIRGAVSFCSEAGMMLAAAIREALDLPGPRPDLCKKLLDKGFQREVWTKYNVPGPNWLVLSDIEQTLAAINNFSFPLIIKPTDSSGSRGVTKIESKEDDITDAVNRAFQFSRSGKVIIESFMEGTEFTVEVFIADGISHVLAVTEKKKVEGTRGTVARELATPDRSAEVVSKIANSVVDAFSALGYKEGPGHAEVILKLDGSVGLVEVAGRGGGFMVFDKLVPSVSGINIAKLTALQSAGIPVGPIAKKSNAAVLRFFPSKPGILKSITGIQEANQLEGVEAGAFVSVGKEFHRAIADGDRLGYILSNAATPQLAQALADEAERIIQFEIIDNK